MKKLAICLMFPVIAHAEFWTGNQLLAKMQDPSAGERMFALGYVSGVSDALTGVVTCPPLSVTVGQVNDMVRSLLEANPGDRHKSADIFVRAAMQAQWPCKKSGNAV
ncbi:hypothetical protein UFOVP274_60 [uncultured Caudovirales phage]|uniref:Rap1a immunity protein domain-containing protein n=1 Tax=uncultured Caudovirales phage TaxID=2100421 RepID=A0A6J5LJN0_9CAUD|nr:hypothetical protein UFOVP274_60 [uncultured Caudovirales phage]